MLWPLRLALARFRPFGPAVALRSGIVAALFGLFLWGDYALFRRLFLAIGRIEELTPFFALGLLQNLLGMVFLVAMVVLFFSSTTAAIGAFFTDLDLELYHAAPIRKRRLAVSRWIATFIRSSYLVVFFLLPMFVALARQYGRGAGFVLLASVHLLLLLAIPVCAGTIVVILLIRFFPVRRIHQISLSLAIVMATVLVIGFRMIRPERLFTEIDTDELTAVLAALELPAARFHPSGWFAEILTSAAQGSSETGTSLLLSSAAAVAFLLFLLVSGSWYRAFVRGRESLAPTAFGASRFVPLLDRFLSQRDPRFRALVGKEIRIVTRDVGQWSQMLMMLALMFLYLYNIRSIPLAGDFRAIFVAYANLAMAGFVISAISLRFAYPSVSAEGRAFWILETAPISWRRLLWVKVLVYGGPLMLLGLSLTAMANVLLAAPPQVWLWTMTGSVLMTAGLVGLGIGMGGISPKFDAENPLEVGLSLGGFAYMALSLLYVGGMLFLIARPFRRLAIYMIFGVWWEEGFLTVAGPVLLAAIGSIALLVVPLELARWRLGRVAT